MRLDEPTEIREMSQLALATQQQAAQLFLELLDCARQRRLRDMAQLRRACEIERVRYRQEVADLVHFHTGKLPRFAISHKSQRREYEFLFTIANAHRNDRRPAFPLIASCRYLFGIETGRGKWTSGKAR